MHLTLKLETTKPAGKNFLQQQAKFDDFIECYNNERPHQALNMQCPAERYTPSPRPYTGLPELDHPFHDKTVTVTTCGRICFNRQKINLSTVFAGQSVGIKQVSEHTWLVTFMDYDLGKTFYRPRRLRREMTPQLPLAGSKYRSAAVFCCTELCYPSGCRPLEALRSEAARVHHGARRRGGVASGGARAAAGEVLSDWHFGDHFAGTQRGTP
jgi:Integrase core domain